MESFKFSDLQLEAHPEEKIDLDFENLGFGSVNSKHMFECEWSAESGWGTPKIVERHSLSLDPSVTSLHYGLQVFEGMKAYKDPETGAVRLFRPELNFERLNRSAHRLGLPTFNVEDAVKSLEKLVTIDKAYIPDREGFSMYIRPTIISTRQTLGLAMPDRALFYIVSCPSGPYFKGGFNPVSLYADTENVRAFKGGVGSFKCGGNYAPTMRPALKAKELGCDQVLWTSGGEDPLVNEAGAMNMFFVLRDGENFKVLTPELDGTILPGITRRSAIELMRSVMAEKRGITVEERGIPLSELVEEFKKGNVYEMFGTGTAAVVSPVGRIVYKEHEIVSEHSTGESLEFCKELYDLLTGIQFRGEKANEAFGHWSHVCE